MLTPRWREFVEQIAGLICAFALGVAAMAMLAGCVPVRETATPRHGIPVDAHGQRVDLEQIDADWDAVTRCWGYTGTPRRMQVDIADSYAIDDDGHQYFEQGGSLWYGTRRGWIVTVPPDLWALKHEFSHIVGPLVGERAENGMGKCFLGG